MAAIAPKALRPVPAATAAGAMIFTSDDESQTIIRKCLAGLGVPAPQFNSGGIANAISKLGREPSPRMLIVDINGIDDPLVQIHELAEVCEPGTGVLVIGSRNDIALYRELRGAGIAEYLVKPLIASQVSRVCHSILTGESDQPDTGAGKLVVTLGVRGGVGATTITARLARYLADVRKRRLIMVDLDLQGGDAALMLDATPQHALRDALEHPERVDDLFLERGVTQISDRLHLLSSLEPLDGQIDISAEAVRSLVDNLAKRYRYVLVDLPPARAVAMPAFVRAADILLLVSDASLASARDIARWKAMLGGNSSGRTVVHILNKSGGSEALPSAEFERAAGQAADVAVPYEREVGRASTFGIESIGRQNGFFRALAPVIETIGGEPLAREPSIFARLLGT
jgi:pilus assembly protein CpaE